MEEKCKKCGTSMEKIKRTPEPLRKNQTFYFKWFYKCPICRLVRLDEDARVVVKNTGQTKLI